MAPTRPPPVSRPIGLRCGASRCLEQQQQALAVSRGKRGTATEGSEPDPKRPTGGKGEDKNKKEKNYKKLTANKVHEVFPTIVKSLAQTMPRTRELESVAFDVVQITKPSLGLETSKKKTTEWAKKVKERAGNRPGQPREDHRGIQAIHRHGSGEAELGHQVLPSQAGLREWHHEGHPGPERRLRGAEGPDYVGIESDRRRGEDGSGPEVGDGASLADIPGQLGVRGVAEADLEFLRSCEEEAAWAEQHIT